MRGFSSGFWGEELLLSILGRNLLCFIVAIIKVSASASVSSFTSQRSGNRIKFISSAGSRGQGVK